MATSRKRSKIEVELPPEVRKSVNRLLVEGATYEEVSEYLAEQGYDISRSSVGRYGKDFFDMLRQLRVDEGKSEALIEGDDTMALEHAASKLLVQQVIAGISIGSINVAEVPRIMSDLAKLQSSSIQRENYRREIRERTEKAAETVEKKLTKAGVTKEVADAIKREVLGIAK